MENSDGKKDGYFDRDISYEDYMNRLYEIAQDCNLEVYFSEIFIPFFNMCCRNINKSNDGNSKDKIKIVPVYDTRNPGKESKDYAKIKKVMEMISAPREEGGYVVPDYIFCSSIFSFDKPCKPYLMVETKKPNVLWDFEEKKGTYVPLGTEYETRIEVNENELMAEIKSCGAVIYTDGITWMVLALDDNNCIIQNPEFPQLSLVSLDEDNKSSLIYGIKDNPPKIENEWVWDVLKAGIADLVNKKKEYAEKN